MVQIKQQLINTVKNGYSGTNGRKYITIHETANIQKGTGAQTHANLQSNGFSASWHWQVDDKIAIQSFRHTAQVWHAGDGKGNGNLNSIAIEICVNSDGDFKKAVKNAAELTKKIMKDEGIPLANVVQHNRWSGKNCPTNLRNGSKGVNWNDFKNMVSGSSGTSTVKPSTPQTGSSTVSKPTSKPKVTWTKVTGNWTGQTLMHGQYGTPVKDLQTKLANNKPPFYPNKGAKNNGIDSYYGDDTKDAVTRFQTYYGLSMIDGMAGSQVYTKLGGKTTSTAKKTTTKANLTVDGVWGKGTTKAIQKALATKQDGIISNQPNNSVTQKIIGVTYGSGSSPMVKKLQKKVGSSQDGRLGSDSIKKLQLYLKTTADGKLSKPSLVVKEMQRRLNKGTF